MMMMTMQRRAALQRVRQREARQQQAHTSSQRACKQKQNNAKRVSCVSGVSSCERETQHNGTGRALRRLLREQGFAVADESHDERAQLARARHVGCGRGGCCGVGGGLCCGTAVSAGEGAQD